MVDSVLFGPLKIHRLRGTVYICCPHFCPGKKFGELKIIVMCGITPRGKKLKNNNLETLLERRAEKPGAILSRVRFGGSARDYCV